MNQQTNEKPVDYSLNNEISTVLKKTTIFLPKIVVFSVEEIYNSNGKIIGSKE